MAPEFKNPQKTLPLVMIFGTVLIIIIYALFVIALGGLLSANEAINAVNDKTVNVNNIALLAIQKLNLQ